jgi:hypothetical protein
MHVDVVPNRGSRPAYLLRESFRDGRKVRKRTLANLSSLADEQIKAIRRVLRGEKLAAPIDLFEVSSTRLHGDTDAVVRAMKRLGFRDLLAPRSCREADVVMGMLAARIVAPHTKLATTRWWTTRTLPQDLGIERADEQELYAAMDWLLGRQDAIEKKLAARHLGDGAFALYDLSSSYFEGTTCPLAKLGYNRDGKKGKLQVNYGLLTDRRGCPVSISVYEGDTSDPKTLMPQVVKLKRDFAIERVVLVGDRGMIGQAAVDELRKVEGLAWITALKSVQIRQLVEGGALQLGLFDEKNLFELAHPDYPGERLVACRNAELGKLRAHKRQELLAATTKELEHVRAMIERGKLRGAGKIGVRVGRVVNKYKVAKHFDLVIEDRRFDFRVLDREVAAEAALDGIYVVRTSVPKTKMSAADTVRSYKALAGVERAFRSMKTIDLKVRPIHHRKADRVRAHIFLCMLAYYVEWHMRDALRPMLFADEMTNEEKDRRDPVAPALRSEAALRKIKTKKLDDGSPAHDFRSLLNELALVVRSTCRARAAKQDAATFDVVTSLSAAQRRAFELLAQVPMYPVR